MAKSVIHVEAVRQQPKALECEAKAKEPRAWLLLVLGIVKRDRAA
jgi:hypothetical protein